MDEPRVQWTEGDTAHEARWLSESGASPPKRIVLADDRMSADQAYGLACQGTALLWRGDYQNARQMLVALANRADRRPRSRRRPDPRAASTTASGPELFHLHRLARSQRARTLGALLVPLDEHYRIALRRAPDVSVACTEALGPPTGAALIPLRALLGLIGAHEWRRKGIEIPAIGGRIHPHYGVFAPIRHEYVDLVAAATLPPALATGAVAFDIGTGTGVLAALLARRGASRVIATDLDARALACARENLERLGLATRVELVEADLCPEGRAALVVCNPPWVPGRPSSPIERGIFDPDSRMLRGFLGALPAHLVPGGEGWLVLSDFAERLGLRTREQFLADIAAAGLEVLERIDARPVHRKVSDESDPLHAARAAEVTSLWRLGLMAQSAPEPRPRP